MADKDPNLDNPDTDDELDLPDLDESMLDGQPGKDRKPIDRVKGGFYEGMRRTALSASTRRKVIDEALPKGYGKAYDDALSAVDLGQELYDTARENLVPVKKDLKKIGRYVASKTDNILPEAIQRKLEELVAPEDTSDKVLDEIDYDKLESREAIESIFGEFMSEQSEQDRKAQRVRLKGESKTRNLLGAQLDLQYRRDQRDEETKLRQDVVGEARYKTQTNLLNMMRSGVERLVDYQDRITASYQRKSLELQYRQFFVARDHFALFKGYAAQTNEHLGAITKNSAIPDFLKIRTSETAQAMLRERTLGKAGTFVQGKTKGLGEALKEKLNNVTKSFSDGVRGAADGLDMVSDIPIDGMDVAGGMAGDAVASTGLSGIAKRLGTKLGKNDSISRFGTNLDYLSSNKSELARDWLAKKETEGQMEFDSFFGGIKADLAGGLLGMMNNDQPELAFGRDASELADEAGVYTSLADKSITEIIPGLLTDLLHETEMIRTQDPTTERRIYDFESGELKRESDVQKKLVERVLPKRRMESIRDDLTSIVDTLDTNGDLSESARMAFTRQLLTDASNGRRFDPERYFSPRGLGEVQDEDDLSAIRELIKGRFLRDDGSFRAYDKRASETRADASRVFNSARDDIPNYQETIGKLLPIYGARTLREAGLLEERREAGRTQANKANILDFANTGDVSDLASQLGDQPNEVSNQRSSFGLDTFGARDAADRGADLSDSDVDRGGLERVSRILERFVEVQQSLDPKKQFANVLDAIAQINPLKHLELNGQWLKDIYELLKNTLGGPSGPSGGPAGPSGGGPNDFSQSRWSRYLPQQNNPPTRQTSRWLRDRGESLRGTMESLKENGVASMSSYRQRLSDQRTRLQEGTQGLQMAVGDGFASAANDARGISRSVGTQISERSRSVVDQGRSMGEDLGDRLSEMRESLSERGGFGPKPETVTQGQVAVNDPRYTQAVRDVVAYLEGKLPSGQDTKSVMSQKFQSLKEGAGQLGDRTQSTLQDMLGEGRGRAPDMMSKLNERAEQASTMSQEFIGKVVERVQDRMASRNESSQTGGSGGDGGEPPAQPEDYWTRARELVQEILTHMDRKTEQLQDTLENLTLAQMAGDSDDPGALKRLGRGAASGLGGIMSFYGGMWKSAGNLASGGTGMLKNLAGKMFQGRNAKSDGIMDIYVKGHAKPAMLARDLRAGRYYDQETGDVVQRLDEVTGPVVDASGDIVISEFDIQEGLLVNNQGKSMMDRLGSITGGVTSYMTSPYRAIGALAGNVTDIGKNWMNKPRDVYVKGEERPRLLAVVMKNGGYLSEATKKPIRSINDIDGAVIDRQGNVVLTLEDMRQGLTDNRGRAIKGLLKGAGRLATGAVKGVSNYMVGSYKAMGRAAKGAVGLVTGRFGGQSGGEGPGSSGGGNEKQVKLLTEIRDILEERMEKPLRKGGWRSQLSGDKQLALPSPQKDAEFSKKSSKKEGGGIGSMLKKLLGGAGIGGGLGMGLDVGMDVGPTLDGPDRGDKPGKGKKPRGGKKGLFRKMFGGLKSIGGKAMRGLGTAARFAIPAVTAAVPAVASAAGTAASAAGGLLAGAGTAIAGILSAPVLLAGAAIAGVGAAGYFAYKHFSRKPDGPLHRVRLAQYGADPDNKDHVGKISGLEDAMGDEVQFEGKRLARLGGGIDLEEAMEDFGVDLEDEVAVANWLMWFQERFKPVYLSHAVVAKDMIDSSDLTDTEDMDKERKRDYLRRTQFYGDQMPYGSASPFEGVTSLTGEGKVNLELTAALKTLPEPTKLQRMDETADVEARRLMGQSPTPLPDVISGPNPQKTRENMATAQRDRRGRPIRFGRAARSPARPSPLATTTAVTAATASVINDDSSTVVRSTGPLATTDTPSADRRMSAESEAIATSRQSPAEQEAAARVEDQRVRQDKVARQTAVQSAASSTRVVSEMQRVASILQASHQTQQSMDKSLRNIDAYFAKLREQDEKRKRDEPSREKGLFDGLFDRDDQEVDPRAGLSMRRY